MLYYQEEYQYDTEQVDEVNNNIFCMSK
jgi:hypothetical protein